MDVKKLIEEYNALEARLKEASENEDIQSLENELHAIGESLSDCGVKSNKTYLHQDCGGTVITCEYELGSEIDICLECGVKGQTSTKSYEGEGYIRFTKPIRD